MIEHKDIVVGEDVIVVKRDSDKFDCIGQIGKVGKWLSGDVKISVIFDGEFFAFRPEDLVLA